MEIARVKGMKGMGHQAQSFFFFFLSLKLRPCLKEPRLALNSLGEVG